MGRQTTNYLRKYAPILALAFVIIAFSWYGTQNWEEISTLNLSSPVSMVPAFLLAVVSIFSTGKLLDLAVEPHGLKLPNNEVLGLSALNRFSNNIAPSYAGAAIRASYFKKKYGLPIAKFTSSFVASNLVQFIISGTIISFILFYIMTDQNAIVNAQTTNFIIILGFMMITLIATLSAPINLFEKITLRIRSRNDYKILARLSIALNGFKVIRRDKSLLVRMMLWAIATILATGLMTFFLYISLSVTTNIVEATFVSAVGGWSVLISITPGGIGIKEGLMIFAANAVGLPVTETIAMALLARLIMFAASGMLSSYYAPKLLNKALGQALKS